MERREDLRDRLEKELTELVSAHVEKVERSQRELHNEAVPWDMESRNSKQMKKNYEEPRLIMSIHSL